MIDWVTEHHTESFIEKNIAKADWLNISRYQKLSESFIEKYSGKVDWKCISRFQKLSEEFIEKHRDKFISEACLGALSLNKKLSEGFSDSKLWKSMWKEHCDKNKPKEKIGYKVRCPKPVIIFLVGLLFVCSSVTVAYGSHLGGGAGWIIGTVLAFALSFCMGFVCGREDS